MPVFLGACLPCRFGLFDEFFVAVGVDVIHQRAVAVGHDAPVHQHMGIVHVKGLEDPGAVGNDEQRAVFVLLV